MNKEFIPYEQSLELKELGFDEPCLAYYNENSDLATDAEDLCDTSNYNRRTYDVSAPLYQQAFRWFREKYGLYCQIEVLKEDNGDTVFDFVIIEDSDDTEEYYNDGYPTYEEAEIACLKKLIEIVKQKL